MQLRTGWALGLVALTVLACGESDSDVQTACREPAPAVLAALAAAPGDVRLADGSPLSDCVEAATSSADVQELGFLYLEVADRLAAAEDGSLRLGYLVGAVRRGAERTNGLQLELVRRLEQIPATDPRAHARGEAAGEARG